MIKFLKYLGIVTFFLLLLFAFHRFIFIIFNLKYMVDADFWLLAKSFAVGLHLDISIIGYIILAISLVEIGLLLTHKKIIYSILNWLLYGILTIVSLLLLGNTILYSFWGRLLDAEAMSFIKTPAVIIESLSYLEIIIYLTGALLLVGATLLIFKKSNKNFLQSEKMPWLATGKTALLILVLAVLTIVPIRGGFGTAPINTGVAYYSQNQFASHSAINPVWNLMYSLKRINALTQHFSYMDETKATEIVNALTATGGETTQLLSNTKPNVVIILLESFSAQVIGKLGGVPATPNFDSLCTEGVLFSNIYAASDRSDKGLVATMAGYQVVPTYSIMQYPGKSQSLIFLPQQLTSAGYMGTSYMYGGDIGFKGMNSFVTLAGFKQIISINDFPTNMQGEKWGVHDEYTFERFKNELINEQNKPFFKFFFTLSSHEPFDVPMEKVYKNPYVNSVHYTDRCLGKFFKEIKQTELWNNTLFILIADHGVTGPQNATALNKVRYHIPMLWTGGALAVKDTVITTIGSQTDMAATLLNQLKISSSGFPFSKNLLAKSVNEFAFFVYPNAFGMITPNGYFVYDNTSKKIAYTQGTVSESDIEKGKAYLQVISADHLKR